MALSQAQVADGLDAAKLHFVEIDGVRTRYYEDGQGEPLVLFHGGDVGSLYSLDAWSLNLPGLARHFHVYAVDKLGQGHTDNPKTPDDYSYTSVFRHAAGFFDALGIRQAHVAGHSRGGFLVTWLALERPDLIKTAIIVDSATMAPDDPRYPLGAFYEKLARDGNRHEEAQATAEFVRIEPDAQAYDRAQVTNDFVRRLIEIAALPKTNQARRKMAEVKNQWWDVMLGKKQELLERIDHDGLGVPMLMLWGFNDQSAPLPLGLELFRRIAAKTPRSELHVLNGAGHYSFRERPDGFNRAVRGFCLD
jgi:2-hydroxy-6-oxo-6-(2'-carboxyphenyl)-hexa-2,4-dienoate hydrolase